jgi:hypothetical protein
MQRILEWAKTHHAAVLGTIVVLENTGVISGKLGSILRVLGGALLNQ